MGTASRGRANVPPAPTAPSDDSHKISFLYPSSCCLSPLLFLFPSFPSPQSFHRQQLSQWPSERFTVSLYVILFFLLGFLSIIIQSDDYFLTT